MDRKKLGRYIDELKEEIGNIGTDDKLVKDRLNNLTASIENSLNESGELEDDGDLIDNVQNNIEQFEAEHPAVTEVLNRIATILSNMGI